MIAIHLVLSVNLSEAEPGQVLKDPEPCSAELCMVSEKPYTKLESPKVHQVALSLQLVGPGCF